MSGLSTYMRDRFWNRILRGPAAPSVRPSAIYVAAFTAIPDDLGAGGVEPGAGYARVQVTQVDGNWSAAVAGLIANLATITIGPATGGNFGKLIGVGLFDALTVGNYLGGFPLLATVPDIRHFVYNGSNGFQIRDHPFLEDEPVYVFGDNLPAPLVENVEYYIKDTSAHVIKLLDAPGGSIITITGNTGGVIARGGPVTVNDGQSFRLNPAAFSLAIVR